MIDTLTPAETAVDLAILELSETSMDIVNRNKGKKSCLTLAVEMEDTVREIAPNINGLDGFDVSTGYVLGIDVTGDPDSYTHLHAYNFITLKDRISGETYSTEADGYDPSCASSAVLRTTDNHPIVELSAQDLDTSVVYSSGSDYRYYGLARGLRKIPENVPFSRWGTRSVFLGENIGRVASIELIEVFKKANPKVPNRTVLPILLLSSSKDR